MLLTSQVRNFTCAWLIPFLSMVVTWMGSPRDELFTGGPLSRGGSRCRAFQRPAGLAIRPQQVSRILAGER